MLKMPTNMNRIINLFIVLFLVFGSNALRAQNYRATIDYAQVNGEPAQITYKDKIVISDTDSIVFEYTVSPKVETKTVRYRTMLIMNQDTSVNLVDNLVVRYANLPEAEYTFKISALSEDGTWVAKDDEISFIVDNELSKLITKIENQESINQDLQKKLDELENENGFVSYLADIALIVLISLIAIFVLIYLKNRPRNKNKSISKQTEGNMSAEEKTIEQENADLRKEIKALRLQIDKMQSQSRKLMVQNKELQETVNKTDKSKKELEDLQKQKEELFSVIVHDIKNPASVIKGLVDLLTNYDSTANDFDDIMKDIAESSSRILKLSSEISKIMALEGTGLNLEYDLVDMNDIAQDVFMRNTFNARNKKLTYESVLGEDLPEINLDVLRIDEVMDNLISNAIKYTEKGGSVLVETDYDKDKKHVIFSVSDTGQGLSEEDIKRTFQKGATLSSKPTGGESATGLGLWIVKKMVEAHDGYVWVKSKKNEGSTFAFSIPVNNKVQSKLVTTEAEENAE